MAGKPGMHARRSTSPTYAEAVRSRIQGSVIADQLQKHVLGAVEMSPTQVSAALGLLRKVAPDLASTELKGDPTRPIAITISGA
jgi:hypothetical protein